MKIGLIAPPWIPVPPPAYGGTEVVVDNLARGLQARGHDVALFSVGESTCPVERRWLYEDAVQPTGTTVEEVAHALAAYDALADCDVVHDHTVAGPVVWARTRRGPTIVTTNHGPFSPELRRIYRAVTPRSSLVAISEAQAAAAPDIPIAAVIHHGIDLDEFAYGPGDGGYLLFVGRMNPNKGVHRAIDIARRRGRPLVVVTKIWEQVERDYFTAEVQPRLGHDVDLRTDVPRGERLALMQGAEALLNPIAWPEPFGLVMPEALACGTPVLATPCGAAPEIVDHGCTGYLLRHDDEWARADIAGIDRKACRVAAERRFSLERMAVDHERLFDRLLQDPPTVAA